MKTITFKHVILLGMLLFPCLLSKGFQISAMQTATYASNFTPEVENSTPPVIEITILDHDSPNVGDAVTARIKAYSPAGGAVTLSIDSAEAFGDNTAVNLAGASFSPALSQQASDTAVLLMHWVPKREHLGFVAFHFSAKNQHNAQTTEELVYLVDLPLIIKPMPLVQLAANEPFELIIPVEDADWHELYEAEPGEGMPSWISVEITSLDGIRGSNAIRLWGTPTTADKGTYSFSLQVRAIFGKETSTPIRLRVISGRNQGWYKDQDRDGFGTEMGMLMACRQPVGYVSLAGDCNDADASIYPGAAELTDGRDNNCNGTVDEVENCYAARVLSFRQGNRPDGKTIGASRSNPLLALGAPQENNQYNFVSLGFGGELVLELGTPVYDDGSEAPDLMVVETTWGWANRACYEGKGAGNPETMVMEVSANGTDWAAIPATFCRNAKVDLSPVVGGKGKLPYARFIKITDTSNPADFHPSANGYDVDGIITCLELFGNLQAHARSAGQGSFDPDFFNEAPDDEESLQSLSAYPNPVKDVLTLETGIYKAESVELNLYNLQGSLVYTGSHQPDQATGQIQLNMQKLNQGVYLLKIKGAMQQHYLKIMKE